MLCSRRLAKNQGFVYSRGDMNDSIDFDPSLCDGKRELKSTSQYFSLHALISLSAD